MQKVVLFILLIVTHLLLTAQNTVDDNDNIVISSSSRTFTFVKGNDKNPVQIKEEDDKTYTCNSFRTSIPVVESYNDIESIDDVDIYVDESKKHYITPKYEEYNVDGIFYSDAHICYFRASIS